MNDGSVISRARALKQCRDGLSDIAALLAKEAPQALSSLAGCASLRAAPAHARLASTAHPRARHRKALPISSPPAPAFIRPERSVQAPFAAIACSEAPSAAHSQLLARSRSAPAWRCALKLCAGVAHSHGDSERFCTALIFPLLPAPCERSPLIPDLSHQPRPTDIDLREDGRSSQRLDQSFDDVRQWPASLSRARTHVACLASDYDPTLLREWIFAASGEQLSHLLEATLIAFTRGITVRKRVQVLDTTLEFDQ